MSDSIIRLIETYHEPILSAAQGPEGGQGPAGPAGEAGPAGPQGPAGTVEGAV